MLEIGRFNLLTIKKQVEFGVYLDGGEAGEILLPRRYVPQNAAIGDSLNVFIYFDSEDCLIATTEKPKILCGQCALLTVKDVNKVGAFMDWGLMKDLLVPYAEQHKPFEVGQKYVVTAYTDKHTGRILASSKLHRHLKETAHQFPPLTPCDLLVFGKTDMGYKVVVDNAYLGLIFRDEAFKPLRYGQRLNGYIKGSRPDGKLDILLQLPAGIGRDELSQKILAYIEAQGGVSFITDKSPPEDIYTLFNVSKANFKKAVGGLLKQGKIRLGENEIRLNTQQ
ncbi:MAG TPA: S1-like domain-containing RNA-binding protein [Cellvibrionaceae bacterium]|nr:S1-like domain-containing RNA-binding protein [Cellvibrionaceae bacterium]